MTVCTSLMVTAENLSESMITLCQEVLAGDSEKIPYNWIGYDLLIARSRDRRMRRLDGELANLAYRPGMEL